MVVNTGILRIKKILLTGISLEFLFRQDSADRNRTCNLELAAARDALIFLGGPRAPRIFLSGNRRDALHNVRARRSDDTRPVYARRGTSATHATRQRSRSHALARSHARTSSRSGPPSANGPKGPEEDTFAPRRPLTPRALPHRLDAPPAGSRSSTMRLSTPPRSPPRIIRASADEEDESITCSKAAGVKTSASMDFDMLFDAAEGASGANERMETVHEDAKDETYSSSDDDVLDPVSVYVRCAPSPPASPSSFQNTRSFPRDNPFVFRTISGGDFIRQFFFQTGYPLLNPKIFFFRRVARRHAANAPSPPPAQSQTLPAGILVFFYSFSVSHLPLPSSLLSLFRLSGS